MAWTNPSPSHRPIRPPIEEKKELRVGFTRKVVVTLRDGENFISILLLLDSLSVVYRVSVLVVVQGRGQSEIVEPSNKSWMCMSAV